MLDSYKYSFFPPRWNNQLNFLNPPNKTSMPTIKNSEDGVNGFSQMLQGFSKVIEETIGQYEKFLNELSAKNKTLQEAIEDLTRTKNLFINRYEEEFNKRRELEEDLATLMAEIQLHRNRE